MPHVFLSNYKVGTTMKNTRNHFFPVTQVNPNSHVGKHTLVPGALDGSPEWLTRVSYRPGQWPAHSPRRVPPGSSAEPWHLSGSRLEQQRQPVPGPGGREWHSQGEARPGRAHCFRGELFLGKAAHFHISMCVLSVGFITYTLCGLSCETKSPEPHLQDVAG